MGFYEDMEKSLLEAIEMEKGTVALEEIKNMPAPTFIVANQEKDLIDQMVNLRKEQKISQKKLAEITGNKQQAISRIEKKEHSPSLQTFCNILSALGYELTIEKKILV